MMVKREGLPAHRGVGYQFTPGGLKSVRIFPLVFYSAFCPSIALYLNPVIDLNRLALG